MEVKLQHQSDVTVVSLSGKIDIEKAQSFADVCQKKLRGQKVVFYLKELQFINSSRIQLLFKRMVDLHSQTPTGVRLAGVSADFMRVLFYTTAQGLPVCDTIDRAVQSFALPQVQFLDSSARRS
jgi:anti-anti-sigma factor